MKYIVLIVIAVFIAGCASVDMNSTYNNSTSASNISSGESSSTNKNQSGSEQLLVNAKQSLSDANYKQAIDASTQVIQVDANNAEAYSIRGFATALQGDTTKGLEDTKRSYELDSTNVANYYNMAMVYKLAGQLNDSKLWFEKVLEKDPNNTWSIYGIATIYADQGDDEKALEWLERAINTDASVKAVAGVQDHFERFHGNRKFEDLVK